MIKGYLLDGFTKSTKGNNVIKGKRILENDLISDIDYDFNTSNLDIFTTVISSDLYNTYNCSINFDLNTLEVTKMRCTCDLFLKNEIKKNNYACEHLTASFLNMIQIADEDLELKETIKSKLNFKKSVSNNNENLIDTLINKNDNEELRLEIFINKNRWNKKISIEFRIGLTKDKTYIIKDLSNFLVNMYNDIPIFYSKDFEFNIKKQKFRLEDMEIINFIEFLKNLDLESGHFKKSQDKFVSSKEIFIPQNLLKYFLKMIKGNNIYLNSGFYSRKIETEIIYGDIPLPIEINEASDYIKISFPRGLPEIFSESYDVFLYDTVIYLPSKKQCEMLKPYLNIFSSSDEMKFPIEQKDKIFKELIPSMKSVTNTLILDEKIKNQIVDAKAEFRFYFDREDDFIKLKVSVLYLHYEFNIFKDFKEKYIYRDLKKEEFIKKIVSNLGFFKTSKDFYIFSGDDDLAFEFFRKDISELEQYGEIFYSENFKGKLNFDKNSFNVSISHGKENYFDFKYSISNILEEEYINILKSFKDNKKYYKLLSGEFIDLQDIKLREMLSLINSLELDKDSSFSSNKSFYVKARLNNILDNFKGKELLDEIEAKFNEIEDVETSNINAKLRDYQLKGVNFFKELSKFGFSGILADEMGLGKTLQAISFLANEKGKNTLIVAPTSLVYNWRDEILKFTKNLTFNIANGDKSNRRNVIENYKDYDVIITTYNLLRLDLDLYKNKKFDYMIIDEAQNIKNPKGKNTKACKEIDSSIRFALTGTPIENNLLELWSVFDFLMPDYLGELNTFNSRYNRNLNEEEFLIKDLKNLIDPFILRRLKKDVLKELPEKIEKIVKVDMTKEQKKIYASYTKYAKDIIEKKIELDEFKSSKIEVLSYITKLRQLALDPAIVTDDYIGDSGKIIALKEILKDAILGNHKVLIFSQFTKVLNKLKGVLESEGYTSYYLDGSVKSEKRQELITKFNNDSTNIFLISLKAGGTGLNLTSADIVIHFDPWWNPAAENQATDRAHRIGQKNSVQVIKLISEGSVEEKILNIQERKDTLIENLIGEGNISNTLLSSLKSDVILELFNRL